MKTLAIAFATLALAPLAVPRAAAAADDSGGSWAGTRIGIGAAVLVDKDGYRSVGAETLLLPGVSVVNKWVVLFGPQVDLRLVGADDRRWWVGVRVEARQDGFEAEDGAFLAGMAERRGGVFAGLAAAWTLDNGLEIAVDAVGARRREQGRVASIELGRTWQAGAWSWKPRVGLEWADKRYIDYYYGVRPQEATPLRPAYTGRAARSVELGLDLRWSFAPRQTLFANLNYERYPNAIRKSPLIEASGIPQLVLGWQYRLR
jgi:MipA family protein